MNKLEVILKQHTPLIHFQHDQEGATLRASEVKPKLDRFILTKLGEEYHEMAKREYKNEYDEKLKELKKKNPNVSDLSFYDTGCIYALKQDWLIKGKEGALDYKIRFLAQKENYIKSIYLSSFSEEKEGELKYMTATFPFLLANMGGKDNKNELKNFSFYKEINLLAVTFNDYLYRKIKKEIISFFLLNNFGNRHNKGFGSFTVKSIDGEMVVGDSLTLKQTFFLSFENEGKIRLNKATSQNERREINSNELEFYEQIFNVIDYYWKRLKSGINYVPKGEYQKSITDNHERYKKSFLFKYLNENTDYTWEKRFIKEKFYGLSPKINPKPYFARAIMGLPDKFTYSKPTYLNKSNPEYPIYQDRAKRDDIKIVQKIEPKTIERIASPIYFKPIVDNNLIKVYVLIKEEHIQEIYANKLCDLFNFEKENNNKKYHGCLSLPLQIINYKKLLNQYNKELLSEDSSKDFFTPKDFRWNNIVEKVKIKHN
ncbi:MAG: hypothetical protein LBV74_10995 [Tannerella sp.]|jgi:hypothetical protein|nr:hypothetical protein [Tannerella sp.]